MRGCIEFATLGYTNRSIDNELKKVAKLDRNNLLKYRTDKSKTDRVPLVLTYSKSTTFAVVQLI
jgi:hypothetical protein